MKDFHCRDTGMSCDYVVSGASDQEVQRQAEQHAQKSHQLQLTDSVSQRIRGLIHDVSSDAHRRSLRL